MNTLNVFSRRNYGTIDPAFRYSETDKSGTFLRGETFAGGDLKAWINNIPVANLEAVTWSTSVEVVGNYAMGSRDPLSYTKGKRVILGSMSLQQFDKHALLEEVFRVSMYNKLSALTVGRLWDSESDGAHLTANSIKSYSAGGFNASSATSGVGEIAIDKPAYEDTELSLLNTSTARGMTRNEYETLLRKQIEVSVREKARELINYPDQIPPFDLTLVGINESGAAASCSIFGIQITQETDGKSMNDMNPTIGLSFVARHINPWRPVEFDPVKTAE